MLYNLFPCIIRPLWLSIQIVDFFCIGILHKKLSCWCNHGSCWPGITSVLHKVQLRVLGIVVLRLLGIVVFEKPKSPN
jgi:hypothetical protein